MPLIKVPTAAYYRAKKKQENLRAVGIERSLWELIDPNDMSPPPTRRERTDFFRL